METPKEKDPAAVSLGKRGGAKKNPNKGFGSLSLEERSELGRRAGEASVAKRKVMAGQSAALIEFTEYAPQYMRHIKGCPWNGYSPAWTETRRTAGQSLGTCTCGLDKLMERRADGLEKL